MNFLPAKVIFLHLSVILFTGGVSNFSGGVPPNFRGEGGLQFFGGVSNFRNTVNVRPVRILLECILVSLIFFTANLNIKIGFLNQTTLEAMSLSPQYRRIISL